MENAIAPELAFQWIEVSLQQWRSLPTMACLAQQPGRPFWRAHPWLKAVLADCVAISTGVHTSSGDVYVHFQRTRGPSSLLKRGRQWAILGIFLSEWNMKISTMPCTGAERPERFEVGIIFTECSDRSVLTTACWARVGKHRIFCKTGSPPPLSFLSGSYILSYWNFLSEYKRRLLKFIALVWRFGTQLTFFSFWYDWVSYEYSYIFYG